MAGIRLAIPSRPSAITRGSLVPAARGFALSLVPAARGLALSLGLDWAEIALRTSAADALQVALLPIVLILLCEALVFRGYLHRNLLTALPA
ncbi:hypothetical protein ACU635_00700 [[Actinomadura] parvosata]|uniref:hypothetical protein n=1 Tax=[Actinomadura] parvosata TaxID=1955412 RepID=UPI00406CDDC6